MSSITVRRELTSLATGLIRGCNPESTCVETGV